MGALLGGRGRTCEYRPITELETISVYAGDVVGLLVMQQHQLRASHIVAIGEWGFVDPSEGFPDHVPFDQYPRVKSRQGFVFDEDFLAIFNSPTKARKGASAVGCLE